MIRKTILVALGIGTIAVPLSAQQRPKVLRIGYLDTSSAAIASVRLDRLRAGLRDLGHVEGGNIVIDRPDREDPPPRRRGSRRNRGGAQADKQGRVGALVVPGDGLFFSQAGRIAVLAAQQRLPALFSTPEPVQAAD